MEPIRAYIRDISKVERLTAEEEVKLSRRIKRGDKEARRRMIHANLPLVISMAKKYSYLGMPLIDLIEEGNIGLMRALVKFNPNKGYRFSTYAAWWIRQYITRSIANQARVVRVPVYMNEMISKWRKVTEKLAHKFGRRATEREVAKEMKISITKVKEISELSLKASSLDTRVVKGGSTHFVDLLEDTSSRTAADELVNLFHHEKVAELLGLMSERERQILNMRFGFIEGTVHSLNEVAQKFGISRERVRQIEQNSLRKLQRLLTSSGTVKSLPVKRKIKKEYRKSNGRPKRRKSIKKKKIAKKPVGKKTFKKKIKIRQKRKIKKTRRIKTRKKSIGRRNIKSKKKNKVISRAKKAGRYKIKIKPGRKRGKKK